MKSTFSASISDKFETLFNIDSILEGNKRRFLNSRSISNRVAKWNACVCCLRCKSIISNSTNGSSHPSTPACSSPAHSPASSSSSIIPTKFNNIRTAFLQTQQCLNCIAFTWKSCRQIRYKNWSFYMVQARETFTPG